jgi:hypothetical protein
MPLARKQPGNSSDLVCEASLDGRFIYASLAAGDGFHFLQKPFCPRTLASMVRECLNQKV